MVLIALLSVWLFSRPVSRPQPVALAVPSPFTVENPSSYVVLTQTEIAIAHGGRTTFSVSIDPSKFEWEPLWSVGRELALKRSDLPIYGKEEFRTVYVVADRNLGAAWLRALVGVASGGGADAVMVDTQRDPLQDSTVKDPLRLAFFENEESPLFSKPSIDVALIVEPDRARYLTPTGLNEWVNLRPLTKDITPDLVRNAASVFRREPSSYQSLRVHVADSVTIGDLVRVARAGQFAHVSLSMNPPSTLEFKRDPRHAPIATERVVGVADGGVWIHPDGLIEELVIGQQALQSVPQAGLNSCARGSAGGIALLRAMGMLGRSRTHGLMPSVATTEACAALPADLQHCFALDAEEASACAKAEAAHPELNRIATFILRARVPF